MNLRISKIDDDSIDWSDIAEYRSATRKQPMEHKDTIRKGFKIWDEFYEAGWIKEPSEDSPNIETDKIKSSVEYKENGQVISDKLIEICENQEMTPEFLLSAHGLDETRWQVVSYKNNYWHSQMKGGKRLLMYQSKITVKPLTGISVKEVEKFYAEMSKKYKTPERKYIKKNNNGLLLEVPICDLHLGKLSLSDDVSEEYNMDLACKRFNAIIDDIIQEVENKNIEQIIFPVGNDFFNIDTVSGTTTAGTPQSCDLSWQQMYLKGIQLLVDGITRLSNINGGIPVKTFCVNGNHDFMSSFHAICYINAWFKNDKMVDVDISSSPRKYHEFGKCLIGFTHGDKEKKRISGIMQIEAREAWGRTLFHEWHMGHLHSEHTKEDNGVIIRNLSSVTGSDTWHHNSGYIGAIKKCQSFLWDKEYGLKNIIHTVIL